MIKKLFAKDNMPKGLFLKYDDGIPEANMGAPCPMLVAGEHSLIVAYYANRPRPEFDGTNPKMMSEQTDDEPCVALIFDWPSDFRSGPPDEEGWYGISQTLGGFHPHAAFVTNLRNWVSELADKKQALTLLERPEQKHFVLAFHDSTIEVIAEGYRVEQDTCSVHEMIARQHEKTD